MKNKFEIERNDTGKQLRNVCFVHEVKKTKVSCRWFYEIVEGVEIFCVINLW